jgi:hypothetical protein
MALKRVHWGTLIVGALIGAIGAPKLRSWFPRLPSYGNGR